MRTVLYLFCYLISELTGLNALALIKLKCFKRLFNLVVSLFCLIRLINSFDVGKSVIRIWSYSGPYFPAFGLNTERHSVSLRIQSECGKIQTRITPNTDTFHTTCYCWLCTASCIKVFFIGKEKVPKPCTQCTVLSLINNKYQE